MIDYAYIKQISDLFQFEERDLKSMHSNIIYFSRNDIKFRDKLISANLEKSSQLNNIIKKLNSLHSFYYEQTTVKPTFDEHDISVIQKAIDNEVKRLQLVKEEFIQMAAKPSMRELIDKEISSLQKYSEFTRTLL